MANFSSNGGPNELGERSGLVKSFSQQSGFGFIHQVDGLHGSDVYFKLNDLPGQLYSELKDLNGKNLKFTLVQNNHGKFSAKNLQDVTGHPTFTSTVKSWNREKSYGFINCPTDLEGFVAGKDIFMSSRNMMEPIYGDRPDIVGARAMFSVDRSSQGLAATYVRFPDFDRNAAGTSGGSSNSNMSNQNNRNTSTNSMNNMNTNNSNMMGSGGANQNQMFMNMMSNQNQNVSNSNNPLGYLGMPGPGPQGNSNAGSRQSGQQNNMPNKFSNGGPGGAGPGNNNSNLNSMKRGSQNSFDTSGQPGSSLSSMAKRRRVPDSAMTGRHRGYVVSVARGKYGFIKTDTLNTEVFFQATGEFETLGKGDVVEFEVVADNSGAKNGKPRAAEMTVCEDAPNALEQADDYKSWNMVNPVENGVLSTSHSGTDMEGSPKTKEDLGDNIFAACNPDESMALVSAMDAINACTLQELQTLNLYLAKKMGERITESMR